MRAIDNSSPEEIKKFQTSKEELWNMTKALEQENAAYRKLLAEKQSGIAQMNKGLAERKGEIERFNGKVKELNTVLDTLSGRLSQFAEDKKAVLEAAGPVKMKPAGKRTPVKRINGLASINLKVLTGDGDLASASAMSEQLVKLGYRVKRVERALRSDFRVNTVYYGPDYGAAAKALVEKLERDAVAKPFDWPSPFDIVVVTGRNSR